MANHKRRRPKSQRAGCTCKMHKFEQYKDTWNAQTRQEQAAQIHEAEARREVGMPDED